MESSGPPATRPRTFPQPLEIPASIHRPGIPTATHSLGDEEPRRKKRKKKTANRHSSMHRAPGLGGQSPPGHPRELRRPWDDYPTTRPLKIQPPSWMTSSPVRADAHAPLASTRPPCERTTNPTTRPLELVIAACGRRRPHLSADAYAPSHASRSAPPVQLLHPPITPLNRR